MKRALLASLALALSACSLDYASLAPFACPTDRQCPGGLSCVFGVGCSPAVADSPCFTHATDVKSDNSIVDTDCSTLGAGAICSAGRCEAPCSKTNTCGNKRVCSLGAKAGTTGVCLTDCTTKNDCPAGLVCQPLWHDDQKGCVDASATPPPACASFTAELDCASKFECGTNFVICPGGINACPTTAPICTATTCGCAAGFSFATCAGAACGGTAAPCVAGNYGCKKDPPGLKCTDSPKSASGACACTDGSVIPVACGSDTSCEKLCQNG